MRTITKKIKLLVFFCILMLAKINLAQSQCAVSFTANPGLNGNYTFSPSVSGNSSGTYYWTFGNGASSTINGLFQAFTSYTVNGSYAVTLWYYDSVNSCSTSATQTIAVSNASCILQAYIGAGQGNNGQYSFFGNYSYGLSPSATYTWDYGDGSPMGNSATSWHTYSVNGTYTVTLWVDNNSTPSCIDSTTISINVCLPTVSLTTASYSNGTVGFTTTSSSMLLNNYYAWNFGDGSSSGGSSNSTTHNYLQNGSYTITAFLQNFASSCSVTAQFTVNVSNVTNPCGLNINQIYAFPAFNGLVYFTNSLPTGTTSSTTYFWDFGDNTSSTNMSPTHTYSANGTYIATLTANNNNYSYTCMDTKTVSVVVNSLCNLNANYTYTLGNNGLVDFMSNSTGVPINCIYNWDFGDGSFGSSWYTQHTYLNGTYTVTLIAGIGFTNTPTCIDTITQVITVTSNLCPLNASFWYTQNSNGVVNFNNNTSNTTSLTTYIWNFGDNSTSTNTSPAHTYSANGSYVATLTANSNYSYACTSTQTLAVVVNSYCNLTANFTYALGSDGYVYFVANATGTPSNNLCYYWNFGNGYFNNYSSFNNNNFSVIQPYMNGTYTVTLVISNNYTSSPSCADTISQVITVSSATCNLVSSFTSSLSTGSTYNFISTSTNTTTGTAYIWYFGDFSVGYTYTPSISYTYPVNGTYTAYLTVHDPSNPVCRDSISQVIVVSGSTCAANANFTLAPTNTIQVWNAFPASPSNVTNAIWSWGDGSYSNSLYTSHTYSTAGLYNICLTVSVSCGASDTSCASYSIYKLTGTNQDMSIIQVNVVDPSTVGIKNITTETLDYSISPNPSNGLFDLTLNGVKGKKINVAVYNIVGALIYEIVGETTNDVFVKNIQLNDTASGVYFIKVSSDNRVTTKKVVINK